MIHDLGIFRGSNVLIHKRGQDVAPEASSSGNVRFGSKADIPRHTLLCPLLGAKQTLNVCFQGAPRLSTSNVRYWG